jgi:hypothetical protein
MTYTWGYLKENVLSKLNLSETEANQQGFLSRFVYYANEAMTQICSVAHANHKFFEVAVNSDGVGLPLTMPNDFIAFDDDVALIMHDSEYGFYEAHDEQLRYYGYNQVIFNCTGTFRIPYKARWYFFTKDLDNNAVITAPADVCDAIPSYVVSQCYKVDDEQKAAIYRNEFEIFLARIDDTSFKTQRTFTIGGGW